MLNPHIISERKSLACHMRIAKYLVRDPKTVIQKAANNIQRWRNTSFDGTLPPALQEWSAILEATPAEDIAKILTDESEEGCRLRSSSPFAGVLNQQERKTIHQQVMKRINETGAS